ncbi:MAG: restriction endonuclease subunit S [Bacilli bacterium]|nr:restriction endonuclease subunit S [Bacilli bacterium]
MNRLNLGKDLYIKGRIGWRGLNKNEYLSSSEYRIINATALMDRYIDWDNCGYISKERFEESKEIMLKEEDILISKDGTIGKIGYVKNLKVPCTVASGIFVVRNICKEKIDSDYLYHLLKSNIFKDFIRRNKSEGSTINHLYQRDLENFEITLPSLSEQKKISNLLNIIDEEIKLKDSFVKDTEETIKNIFTRWFMEYKIDSQNNCELIYDENMKINIPKDWRVLKLSEIEPNIITGKTPSTKNPDNFGGNIPFVTIDDIRNGTYIVSSAKTLSKIGADSQKNKYLPIDSICVTCIATVGLCGLTTKISQTNQQINSIVCKEEYNKFYLLNYLKNYFSANDSAKNGNIFKNMNKDDFSSIYVIYPRKEDLIKFYNYVKSFYDIIKSNLIQINELNELKKSLLPLLMNGQIKIED